MKCVVKFGLMKFSFGAEGVKTVGHHAEPNVIKTSNAHPKANESMVKPSGRQELLHISRLTNYSARLVDYFTSHA